MSSSSSSRYLQSCSLSQAYINYLLPTLSNNLYLLMSTSSSPIVELTLSRKPTTPQETFLSLAEHCDTLGVTQQDVYGDYSAAPGATWLGRFEEELSEAVGKQRAIFLPSGCMAQSIALLIHQQKSIAKSECMYVCRTSLTHSLTHSSLNHHLALLPQVNTHAHSFTHFIH